MCSQVLQTVTLISACLPYLREFLRSFPSGMFQPIENQNRGLRYAYQSTGNTGSDATLKHDYALHEFSHMS